MDNLFNKYKDIIDGYYSKCTEENRIAEKLSIIGISHHILKNGMNVYIEKSNDRQFGERVYVSMEPLDVFQVPPYLLNEIMESGQRQSYLMLEKDPSDGTEKIVFNVGYGNVQTANIEISEEDKCNYEMLLKIEDDPIFLQGEGEEKKDIKQLLNKAATYLGPYNAVYKKAQYNFDQIETRINDIKRYEVRPIDIERVSRDRGITESDFEFSNENNKNVSFDERDI